MPVLAAAAAAVFTAATTFATAVGTAALASAGLGSLATMGIASFTGSLTIGTLVGALSIGSTALSLFSAAKKPKAGAGGMSPVAWKADPNAYIPVVAGGPVGVGGNQVFGQTAGSKNRWLQYVTVLSHCGPCVSVTPFKANDELVTFGRDGGQGADGRYKDRFWMKNALGIVGAAATIISATGTKYVPTTNGGLPPEWTAQHKLSGMAHSVTSMWADPEKIPQIPKHLWEVVGGPVYDPRKDSTQPGGVGPQRWNDRSTWSTVGNTNPYLQAITFSIGHTFNGVRVAGVGAPITAIDVPAFVYGANVCDANGWTIAWQWHTGMRKWDVLATMLQAGAGLPLVRGSKISCMVDAPRVSIGTITDADLRGDFSVTGCSTIRDRKNAIIPRCKSAAHKWSVQPHGRIAPATYLAEDNGQDRPVEVEFESVADPVQVRQLAALELANLREGLAAVIPVSASFLKYRAGDCLTVNAGSTLLTGQKIVVVKREFDHQSRVVQLTVRSETDGKHAFAMGQLAEPPPSPTLVGADPTVIEPPAPDAWEPTPGQVPGGGTGGGPGTPTVPVIVIVPTDPGGEDDAGGAANDDPAATEVVVRYRRTGDDPTTMLPYEWAYQTFPARADRLELTGLAPGVQYEVELAYKVRGITSAFTSYGLVTTGGLVSTDTGAVGGRDAQQLLDEMDAVPGQIAAAAAAGDEALALAVSNLNLAIGQLDTEVSAAIAATNDALAALDTELSGAVAATDAAAAALALRVTEVEVDINDPATGLLVRVGTVETATTDQASRITVVEQQVQTPGTGLLARAASLETATANLQTGKADATRVTALEATVQVRPNMIANGTGRQGLRGWSNPWFTTGAWTWGPSFYAQGFGVGGYSLYDPIVAIPGYYYVLSGEGYANNLDAGGNAGFSIYGSESATPGHASESYITGVPFGPAAADNSFAVPFLIPAGKPYVHLYAVSVGPYTPPGIDTWFWKLKLEQGTVPSLYTDDAVASDLSARALTLETATADLAAGKADASRVSTLEAQVQTAGTGLLSRTTAVETATANLQTGKADASRVTALEATVDTPGTGLSSRTGSLETATANLQTGKADASRVTTLEAQVQTPDTGLLSRTTAVETATADLQTGKADASRVTALEATVNTAGTGLTARTGSLETATANLQTGKADASRVTTLEARTNMRPNLILNPSGRQGVRGWSHYGTPWFGTSSWAWGTFFTFSRPASGVPLTVYAAGDAISVAPEYSYVLSGRGYADSVTSGYVSLDVYAYDGPGSFAGEVLLGSIVLPPRNDPNDLVPLVVAIPAGKGAVRVWANARNVENTAAALGVAFYQLKFEQGTSPSLYSEEATSADLSARAATLETATADLATGKADASRVTTLEAQVQDVTTGLLARATSLETATANLQTGKADASRVTALEATVNTAGTGLTARTGSLETVTANLQTGKADASRVTTLEAQVNVHPNMLYNGSARQGVAGWVSPFFYASSWMWGEYFAASGAGGGARYSRSRSMILAPNYYYTLSGKGYKTGAAEARVSAYAYTDAGLTTGEELLGSMYLGARNDATHSALTPVPFLIPAGKPYVAVWIVDAGLAVGTDLAFWALKVEQGTTASLYTDEGDVTGLAARATSLETATANLETGKADASRVSTLEATVNTAGTGLTARTTSLETVSATMQGQLLARWAIGAAVPGAEAFIEARAETVPGSPPTSSVAIGARQFAVFNPAGADWKKALEVVGGNVVLSGGLQAGAFIRLGNGQGWPVALKAVDFNAADGGVVSFGTDLGALPSLTFAMNNLLPLTAGETYDVKATGLTSTGFTLSAKINVPGTPTSFNRTAAYTTSAFGSQGYAIDKTADADSSDGTYRIAGAGINEHAFFGLGAGSVGPDDMDYASSEVQVWAKKGGTWQYMLSLYTYSEVDRRSYPSGQYTVVGGGYTLDETVQLGDGVQEVGIRAAAPSSYQYVSGFSNLIWTAPGTSSGTRTALASGATTRIRVQPQ